MSVIASYLCCHFQLDGWIARNFENQISAIGSFIDPLADKMLVSVLCVTLTMMSLLPGEYGYG